MYEQHTLIVKTKEKFNAIWYSFGTLFDHSNLTTLDLAPKVFNGLMKKSQSSEQNRWKTKVL